MSALSEQIRVALFGKLNVSGVTSLATGGVFYGEAKQDSNYPLLLFQKAANDPSYTFGFTLAMEESLWFLQAYADRDATGASPIGTAESILAAAITTVGQELTLSSGTCLGVMRAGDIPELKEPLSGRNIYRTGAILRIWAR